MDSISWNSFIRISKKRFIIINIISSFYISFFYDLTLILENLGLLPDDPRYRPADASILISFIFRQNS